MFSLYQYAFFCQVFTYPTYYDTLAVEVKKMTFQETVRSLAQKAEDLYTDFEKITGIKVDQDQVNKTYDPNEEKHDGD